MRTTFILPVIGLFLNAVVAKELLKRQTGSASNTTSPATTKTTIFVSSATCQVDVVYQALYSNTNIAYDVSTICLDLLGIQPVTQCAGTTVTTRKYVICIN